MNWFQPLAGNGFGLSRVTTGDRAFNPDIDSGGGGGGFRITAISIVDTPEGSALGLTWDSRVGRTYANVEPNRILQCCDPSGRKFGIADRNRTDGGGESLLSGDPAVACLMTIFRNATAIQNRFPGAICHVMCRGD